jgi:hypothetical protein
MDRVVLGARLSQMATLFGFQRKRTWYSGMAAWLTR